MTSVLRRYPIWTSPPTTTPNCSREGAFPTRVIRLCSTHFENTCQLCLSKSVFPLLPTSCWREQMPRERRSLLFTLRTGNDTQDLPFHFSLVSTILLWKSSRSGPPLGLAHLYHRKDCSPHYLGSGRLIMSYERSRGGQIKSSSAQRGGLGVHDIALIAPAVRDIPLHFLADEIEERGLAVSKANLARMRPRLLSVCALCFIALNCTKSSQQLEAMRQLKVLVDACGARSSKRNRIRRLRNIFIISPTPFVTAVVMPWPDCNVRTLCTTSSNSSVDICTVCENRLVDTNARYRYSA